MPDGLFDVLWLGVSVREDVANWLPESVLLRVCVTVGVWVWACEADCVMLADFVTVGV